MTPTPFQRALADALEYLAGTIAGPVVEPYPQLTPATWRNMRCRDGIACHCEVCTWEAKYGPRVAEWNRAQSLRPRTRTPLPTLDHLLVCWAERTAYRSAAGALLARARDEAPPAERSRVPWAVRRAEVAMEVDRAVAWAYRDAERFGVTSADAAAALMLSVRGAQLPDVDPELFAAVVRAGRRGALIDLAARGLCRLPKGQRDQLAVADRIRELEQKRVA